MNSHTNVTNLEEARSTKCDDAHVVKPFMIEKEFLIFYTQWLQKQQAETFSKEWVLNSQEWYTNEQLVQKYLAEVNKKSAA